MRKRRLLPRITLEARHVEDNVDKFGRPDPLNPLYTPFDLEFCTVQPYVGDDLIVSGDGFDSKTVYTIFTETEVTEGEDDSTIKPDEVKVYGKWYRVAKVKRWQTGVIPHYEIIVVKKQGGTV